MNLFRSATVAVALMLPFGLAQATTSNTPPPPPLSTLTNPHPSFSVTEDRVLNLRETGSQIVIQTIENALRQGGLALLGEGFQLDSSLSYHSGDNKGIEGDLDVVIPLWNGGRHAIFTQPGFVFWTGHEEEERIDGNIGLVYRAEITRDLIAGASVFYDHDFQIGHSRVGGGIDLQSGFFQFGANYYHVLSEIEDGREGFVEEAVDGMDARLVFEREVVRLGSTVGYWDYEGEESSGGENSQSGWQTSIGMDFGFRVLPGVFIEGSWERHKDDLVLDERIFAGLAFRFSLPDFEGASYGDGSMSANLYKIVDREKRILYEERESDGIRLIPDGNVVEGGTVNVAIELIKPSTEDVVINLVGSGTATYGDDGDYLLNNGSGNCSAVTGTSCQITITAGETVPADNVVVTINNDGRGEGAETIILSTTIASGDASLTSRPLVLTIPVDPPLPAVSISATERELTEGGMATLTATLTEAVSEDVVINLLEGGAADYGTDMDWHLNNGTGCSTATGTSCQITIMAGQTSATATVNVNTDTNNETSAETFTVSIDIASPDSTVVMAGSPSSLTFTIPADLPLPTVSLSASSTSITEGNTATVTLTLSRALGEDATFNLTSGGAATYGTSDDWNLSIGGTDCDMASESAPCQVTISQGDTTAEAVVEVNTDSIYESTEKNFTVSVAVDSGSTNFVQVGNSSSLGFTIPEDPITVGFRDNAVAYDEPNGNMQVSIPLSFPVAAPSRFRLRLSITGTGVGDDIALDRSSIDIAAGATEAGVGVTLFGDNATEPDEVFTITITGVSSAGFELPEGWSIGNNSIEVTIRASD